jgi:hypothetical protein
MAKANLFNSIQLPKIGSNVFDLSHDVKMSFKMGGLYPTCAMDCVPGDKVKISTETMLRFAPLIAPVMHKVNVTTHYFFVPNRILWPNWEQWITGNLDVTPPYAYFAGTQGEENVSVPVKSLGDYLGIPTNAVDNGYRFPDRNAQIYSPFSIAAYNKIWNEYYRDQNLQAELEAVLTDGENAGFGVVGDGPTYLTGSVKNRAWQHDYFTSCLPWAQKGDAVTIPIGEFTDVPIEYNAGTDNRTRLTDGSAIDIVGMYSSGPPSFPGILRESGGNGINIDNSASLKAKTSELTAEAADINSLRRAFRLQEWLERNARGGTRYIESILAHFGVKSSDARLQRPEYLGGSKGKMVISEVLSTAETTAPVGQMAGHGISVSGGNEFSYKVEEHGWIIGLISVTPDTAYQQGLHRSLDKFDRLDYYWPTFANIGEQEVKAKEIYASSEFGDTVFGYVPRYAEYKYMNSRVAGEMKTSLDYWHLGRIFAEEPNLNGDFISCEPSTRIFAVEDPDVDNIYAHIFNNIKAIRKMPKYGTPSF